MCGLSQPCWPDRSAPGSSVGPSPSTPKVPPSHTFVWPLSHLHPTQGLTGPSFLPLRLTAADMGSGEKWLNCKSDFLAKYLKPGAAGPAQLPMRVPAGGRVQRREPAGRASGPQLPLERRQRPHQRLDVYRPTAHSACALCSTPAAQHCCYDAGSQLLTRGKGAGAPDLVSTNV